MCLNLCESLYEGISLKVSDTSLSLRKSNIITAELPDGPMTETAIGPNVGIVVSL